MWQIAHKKCTKQKFNLNFDGAVQNIFVNKIRILRILCVLLGIVFLIFYVNYICGNFLARNKFCYEENCAIVTYNYKKLSFHHFLNFNFLFFSVFF